MTENQTNQERENKTMNKTTEETLIKTYQPEKDPLIQTMRDLKQAHEQIIRLRRIIDNFKQTLEPVQRNELERIERETQ
jgi:hypothetical protein